MDDDNKETSDIELIREKEQQLKRITLMYESALECCIIIILLNI